jgi:epoxyqueuosine reductase
MGPMADEADDLAAELVRIGQANGLDAVGIAPATPFTATRRTLDERKRQGLHAGMQFTYRNPERSTDPQRALPGAQSLVVGARSYRLPTPTARATATHNAGAVARYSWIDHYEPLREGLRAIAGHLDERGWRTKVLADDNALVDREAAYRAGLGTYGKNTMLLLHGRGSEFVLGAVVTDALLPPAKPAEELTGCGTCDRCLPACPTGALTQPGVLDANRCLAWLVQQEGTFPREHRAALGDRLYGCDACQDVCPPNRLEIRRREPRQTTNDIEATVDVVDLLLEPDDAALLERHGRWYIAARQARHLRRNALVVLGNVGDGHDRRTAEALTTGLGSDDPLVRAHAVWAAARLGRPDLLHGLDHDDAPEVRDELGALPPPRQA